MEARVTVQSQAFRLRERMQEANIRHGQEVRADLPHVRVLALAEDGVGQALFCETGPIRVQQVLNRGDDRPLPTDVTLQGLHVLSSGTYDILNALVSSNGTLSIVVDEQTRVVVAARVVSAGQAPIEDRGLVVRVLDLL